MQRKQLIFGKKKYIEILKILILEHPIIPILISVNFVLEHYSKNVNDIRINIIFGPFIVSFLLAILFFYTFKIFLKNTVKANVLSSVVIILFYSYATVMVVTPSFQINIANIHIGKSFLVLPFYLLIFIALIAYVKSTKKDFLNLLKLLLIVAILINISVINIVINQISVISAPKVKSNLKIKTSYVVNDKNEQPDIYLIMPEDYSAPLIYKKYFNYDESTFTAFLKNKGFYLPEKSTSNYPKTFLSLASQFNLEYLDYLSVYKNSQNQTLAYHLIEDNNAVRFLKSIGYHYYQLGSWWGPTRKNHLATENLTLNNTNPFYDNEFNYNYIHSTILFPLLSKIFPQVISGDFNVMSWENTLKQFETLKDVTQKPSPKYVFAHIIAPHEPYVFDKECNFTTTDDTQNNSDEINYVNQTICINQLLENTVNEILTESKKPPVILIQTDEGAPFLNQKLNPLDNWKTASPTLLREKFPVFSAYYFPDEDYSGLSSNITPVNSFRIIFNKYFGTNLAILPDKNYIFQDLRNLYQFKDVTNIIQGGTGSFQP